MGASTSCVTRIEAVQTLSVRGSIIARFIAFHPAKSAVFASSFPVDPGHRRQVCITLPSTAETGPHPEH